MPKARNTSTIQGAAMLANLATLWYPQAATMAIAAPTTSSRDHPAQAVGVDVRQSGHLQVEDRSEGRRRHRDHGAGQEAEHDAVGQVVQRHQLATADFLQLVVQREPGPRGDGRREGHPTEHGQQVAQQQTHDQIEGAHARGDEQRADHQLRARHVFAGVHAHEALEPQQRRWGTGSRSNSPMVADCSSVMVLPPHGKDLRCVLAVRIPTALP